VDKKIRFCIEKFLLKDIIGRVGYLYPHTLEKLCGVEQTPKQLDFTPTKPQIKIN